MRENRKQKQKKNSSFADCLQSAKLGKKTPGQSLCRLQWEAVGKEVKPLPTATPKAVGKEHFKKKYFLSLPTAELAASRQTIFEKIILCRLPRNQQSAKPAVRADGATWLCRLLAWQLAKALPTVCHVAVGKSAFADPGFADCSLPTATWLCGRQSLCRLGLCLCRPGQAVGKEAFSCSVASCHSVLAHSRVRESQLTSLQWVGMLDKYLIKSYWPGLLASPRP